MLRQSETVGRGLVAEIVYCADYQQLVLQSQRSTGDSIRRVVDQRYGARRRPCCRSGSQLTGKEWVQIDDISPGTGRSEAGMQCVAPGFVPWGSIVSERARGILQVVTAIADGRFGHIRRPSPALPVRGYCLDLQLTLPVFLHISPPAPRNQGAVHAGDAEL